jgi:hypothetical protein
MLLAGIPSMVFGYVGGLFAYLTGGAVMDTWWFHIILVVIPSTIGGVVVLSNTWLKHRLEMEKEALRLPKDPRPRPHLVEPPSEDEEQAS